MKQKKNTRSIGLGSGLSSLLGTEVEKKSENLKMIPVEFIQPGPWQPRKIFNNNEVVFYSNIGDLSKKIQRLLDNDKLRINIAKAGYNKYHKYMNSNLVTEYMINKTFNINSKKKYIWEF